MSKERFKRLELAKEFARDSEHSVEEIDKVLAAYFDPDNPEVGLEKFMHNLEEMAVSGRELTENDLAVIQALNTVLADVKDARLFNETYLGHMLTEASIPGMLGYIMGIRTGSNTVAREVSIFESELEPEAIKGLLDMVGFDRNRGDGTFTSGGSMAMQTALMAARRKMAAAGVEPTRDHPLLVLGTPYTHYSVAKMCDIIGGPSGLVQKRDVGVNQFKMDADSLEVSLLEARRNHDTVMAIVAIGGETETGIVDPIREIVDLGEKYGVPVIVDGAYGAPYNLSRNGKLFEGMGRAFAVTIDPHKALNTPYSNGATLFREKEDMYLGYGDRSTYLGRGANLGQKRIEGSMGPGPILSTVAVMRALGSEGLTTLYDLTLDRTEHMFERVMDSEVLQNLYYPELNLLCFTIKPEVVEKLGVGTVDDLQNLIDETRKDLDGGIKGRGGYFFSATALPLPDGKALPVFRACLMNPRTTNAIVDASIGGLEKIIKKRIKK